METKNQRIQQLFLSKVALKVFIDLAFWDSNINCKKSDVTTGVFFLRYVNNKRPSTGTMRYLRNNNGISYISCSLIYANRLSRASEYSNSRTFDIGYVTAAVRCFKRSGHARSPCPWFRFVLFPGSVPGFITSPSSVIRTSIIQIFDYPNEPNVRVCACENYLLSWEWPVFALCALRMTADRSRLGILSRYDEVKMQEKGFKYNYK